MAFVRSVRLCDEVHLSLTYRWFRSLGLDDIVLEHLTFSKNRHGRFRDGDVLGTSSDRRERKKVEMLFAHLKRILKLDRLRLRGPSGAHDGFLLAATAQNLRRMAIRFLAKGDKMKIATA
jgi:hypothetical protein